MTFLAPLALFALAAALVPPLLHLFQRREPPVIEFPAVRYLKETQREALRTVRLQHLLLMLLRMAAVILIALAAARPVVPGGFGARHEPMALVIVFDHSLSSGAVKGGTRVLDDLAARARETLREAQAADAVWLIGADAVARRGGARELILAVSAARPDARRLDLSAAVRQGARLIATSGYARGEIHVLSDMQRSAFSVQLSAFDSLLRGIPVLAYHPAGDPPPNRGVVLAQPSPSLWLSGAGAVLARVAGAQGDPASGVTLAIVVDGRSGARALAAAGGDVVLAPPLAPPLAPGWHTGVVTLEPDELRADDERPFAVRVAPPAVVSISGDPGPFVGEALGVLAANGRVRLSGAPDVRIGTSLAGGSVVLLPPNDPAEFGAINRALSARGVPWRFGARKESEDTIAARDFGEVAGARVKVRYPIEPLPGAPPTDVLARAGADAWIVRHDRVVIVGSRLVPEETTLPLGGAFVPFVSALVNRIARGESGVLAAAPGDNVTVPAGVTAIATRDSLLPARPGEVLAAPVVPGAYALRAGTDTIGMLVVAADPRESDLTRATPQQLRAAWAGASVQVADTPRDYAVRRFRGAGRSELTGWLLAAAMLVLLAEGVMAAGGRLRGRGE
jgi:hypothetical protein